MGDVIDFPRAHWAHPDPETERNSLPIHPVVGLRTPAMAGMSRQDMIFKCHCGSELYHLTPVGATCANCGVISNDWV